MDGRVDEDVWRTIRKHTEFYITDPDTLEPAKLETAWQLVYNDDGLYVSVQCEQDEDTLVQRLSAPDMGFLNRDYVNFVLDTSGEGRYGFWFQLNLGGSRADGTIQPERQFSDSWNGAWLGKTSTTDTGWSAEFYIPWSIVSMPKTEGERQMGIVMQRKIAHIDERVGFPPLPFTQPRYLSAFQKLVLKDVTPKQQLSFFPQLSTIYDSKLAELDEQAGIDVFWRPSTNHQVTGTLHPDFGTVEADDVIINLTAIEPFFPEKRLFFLEGHEIFVTSERSSRYSSNTPVMLLHTRRIGQRPITPDLPLGSEFDTVEFRRPAQLIGAAKATGQIGSLRYGVLSAFEDDSTFHGTLDSEEIQVTQVGREFTVMRGLVEKSNGNYKGFGIMSTVMDHPSVQATTHGIDAHFFSGEGKVKLDAQLLMSDVAGEPNGYGGFVELNLAPTQGITHELVAESFDSRLNLSHVGYMPRNDFDKLSYRFRLRRFGMDWFKETSTRFSIGQGWNSDDEVIMSGVSMRQEFTFYNQTQFRVSLSYDPDAYDDLNSYGHGSFLEEEKLDFGVRYSADSSKRFYYQLSAQLGSESKEGQQLSLGSFWVYRPLDHLSFNASISYRQRDSWVLYRGDSRFTGFMSENWSPRVGVDYFLSAQQHLSMDLQWQGLIAREDSFYFKPDNSRVLEPTSDLNLNEADDFGISRLSMQLRYRWEMAPMSDIFVVYSKHSDLPNAIQYGFVDQLKNTLDHSIAEGVVVKVRHRLGS